MTERELQRELVKELRDKGYQVVVTSNRRKTANTRGTPDLFVRVGNWYWVAVEVKKPEGGKLSKEQVTVGAIVAREKEETIKTIEYLKQEISQR